MTASIAIHQPKHANNPVAQALQNVLTSTYELYLATHNYHWNVEGPQFVPLHKLFEEQYNELFKAIDSIAERIRTLDDYALPFDGNSILEVSKMISDSLNKETDPNDRADRMVESLITLNEAVIKTCQSAKLASHDIQDDETENLMVERITAHQKVIWMLRSLSK